MQRLRHLPRAAILQVVNIDALFVHVARLVEPRDPGARLVEEPRLARHHHDGVQAVDGKEAHRVGLGLLAVRVENVFELDHHVRRVGAP